MENIYGDDDKGEGSVFYSTAEKACVCKLPM